MLWTASGISGYAIVANDGQLGSVSDFLFDDDSWQVRWLVVDTGNWLSGRKVLLPPSVLGHLDPEKHEFSVRLSMSQVKGSPGIMSDRSVSRREETNIYDYYGWPPYWGTGFYMGGYSYTGDDWADLRTQDASRRERDDANARLNDGDPHLRSVAAVTGYHVHATDCEVGHVEDCLVEDADWSIHYLVVDTMNWWPSKKVLISPAASAAIDWPDRLVNRRFDREAVKDSPEYDAKTTVDRAYEKRFHDRYDRIRASALL